MASIFGRSGDPQIPWPLLARDVLSSPQKLIPFLGAGASLAGAAQPETDLPYPAEGEVEAVAAQLGLTGMARAYFHSAVRNASDIQRFQDAPADTFTRVRDKPFPPSARELANALAAICNYEGAWPFSLLSVSGYHEFVQQRDNHWATLKQLFESKTTPLPTHELIARAARHHLRTAHKDYLVITTNYDVLTERAFEAARVPYCVITVDRNDRYVDIRFDDSVRIWLGFSEPVFRDFSEEHRVRYPEFFTLGQKPKPIAVIYKIHGCLFPEQGGRDSIVLSDEDYIAFLKRQGENGDGMVPAAIKLLMQNKGFLFLGYSFSDWNIRSIFQTIVGKRAANRQLQDYAVVGSLSPYESAYFTQRAIHILVTDLVGFVGQIQTRADPAALSGEPPLW